MNQLEMRKTTFKRKREKVAYIVKSYLRIEPCGYCGKVIDPNVICYKCFPMGSKVRKG